MKKYIILFFIFVFFGASYSCNDIKDMDKQKNETGGGGDLMVYAIEYTVELINKTNVAVMLYEPASFYLNLQNDYIAPNAKPYIKIVEIDGEGKKSCNFSVSLKHTLYTSDDPSQPIPSAETLKAQFVPYIGSFFLLVNVGGTDSYLAGWPPEYNTWTSVPQEYDNWTPMPPPAQIVQNSIGWAENTEIRVKNFAYVPFTVKYGNKTEDFDDAITVKAQATLTVNSATDIRFETVSLSR